MHQVDGKARQSRSPSPEVQDAARRRAAGPGKGPGTEHYTDGKLAAFALFKEFKAQRAPTIEQRLKKQSALAAEKAEEERRYAEELAATPDLCA